MSEEGGVVTAGRRTPPHRFMVSVLIDGTTYQGKAVYDGRDGSISVTSLWGSKSIWAGGSAMSMAQILLGEIVRAHLKDEAPPITEA